MAFRTVSAALVVLLLAALPERGQENSEPRLVNLNVVAVDAHGVPVDDLTAEDVRITDSGKSQKIVFFRHKDTRLWKVPSLVSNQFSNCQVSICDSHSF
jgi:hypothetical protein